jgi:hypothetical protein
MHCEPSTGTGYAVVGLEISNAFADTDDGARTAIARTLRLIESGAHSLKCGKDSVTLDFVNNIPNEIGARAGFLQKTFSREFGRGTLSSSRNN